MKKILKFNIGKISLYLFIFAISKIILVIFGFLKFNVLMDLYFIFFYLNQLGQIIGGLSIYVYQYRAFYKNKHIKYFGLQILQNKANIKRKDKQIKILILIFFAPIFEFFIIIIDYHYSIVIQGKIPHYFTLRTRAITTIVSSLLCSYSLNFNFGKHHKVSRVIMSVILIIEFILEIFFRASNILVKPFIFELFSKILRNVIISFIDCIEKY